MNSSKTTFKGNLLLTYRTMFLWLMPLFSIIFLGIIYFLFSQLAYVLIFVYVGFILYDRKFMFYFFIADDKLEIRNHFMCWYKKSFLLKDINSVRIDMNFSFKYRKTEPYFLRIFTTPTTHQTFKACTLRKKDWRGIKAALEHEGIRVTSTFPAIDIKFSDML